MKTVAFYTLGCKLNFSETSTLARQFEGQGFKRVNFEEGAEVYIINTCSVTNHADRKCKKVVREALKYSPKAFIAIVGCYAQLKPTEIAGIPGVDAVLGASEKFRLHELLPGFVKQEKARIFNNKITEAKDYVAAWSANDRTRTFLKVQDGCDYSCSFCTIPLARGNSRSDSVENIVAKAKEIIVSGAKEIVLTGVNIGDFGLENGIRKSRFAELVKALNDNIDEEVRFRISSIEPNLLTDEIIELVAKSNKFVPHFHIPLQSGSNKILSAMRRRYKRELYSERVAKIKSLMPNACIGVDVIVGFPGETQADFLESYQFINELDIAYLHVFTYSERPNTLAQKMPNPVPGAIRAERSAMLHNLSEKKRRHFYTENLGNTHQVLFEAEVENGIMFGFTENYVKVAIPYDPILVNEIALVRLTEIGPDGKVLVEHLVSETVH